MPTCLYFVLRYFPSYFHTPRLKLHSFITTQFVRSPRWRYKRVRMYSTRYAGSACRHACRSLMRNVRHLRRIWTRIGNCRQNLIKLYSTKYCENSLGLSWVVCEATQRDMTGLTGLVVQLSSTAAPKSVVLYILLLMTCFYFGTRIATLLYKNAGSDA